MASPNTKAKQNPVPDWSGVDRNSMEEKRKARAVLRADRWLRNQNSGKKAPAHIERELP